MAATIMNFRLLPMLLGGIMALAAVAPAAVAETAGPNATPAAEIETFSIHGQFTNVTQYHPSFTSPYQGPNSLDKRSSADETSDVTLYVGFRLFQGVELYLNPEIDQGFGLSNTLGVAGFPSGEAYKVGAHDPYFRLHRAFIRLNFGLGGSLKTVDPDKNQLGGTEMSNNMIITLGKFAVTDIFDNNIYAHDPRADFLNWSLIDAGAFDYAADAWGYTYGVSGEWKQSWWTLRLGLFDLSTIPNSEHLEKGFKQFSMMAEAEERHVFFHQPGKFKVLLYVNRGRMANYAEALGAALATGNLPDVSMVRRYQSRLGLVFNLEQQIAPDLGVFARASLNDGHKEAYEFSDINQSISAGLSLKGERWNRQYDTVGIAGVVNAISGDARAYFAAGGLGILIGDGQLSHYSSEKILEIYYSAFVFKGLSISADYQYIANPAYNSDRGPVSVFTVRTHAEF